MANMLKNKFIFNNDRLDFSRSIFRYEKRHSTNLLSGMITPVHHQFLYPGETPDFNFGCVLESAQLIATNFDNIYVDVVSIWTPIRLVMTDWNEFLGESHSLAFTINRDVTIPKITQVICNAYPHVEGSSTTERPCSKAFAADNYLAPHIGFRVDSFSVSEQGGPNKSSIFYKGISVLPSRVYELNWNTFFRNENVQAPILIDKTSVFGTHDLSYKYGLGKLQVANKLKSWYTDVTPAPSLLDVSLGLGDDLPILTGSQINQSLFSGEWLTWKKNDGTGDGLSGNLGAGTDSGTQIGGSATSGTHVVPSNLWADTASLTVNKMYYALMEQRFANKMMKGRRATEFYNNFFGVSDSEAGHDLPKLLLQKRYPLNISQVVATASGSNGSETSDLGQKGAFSVTGFGDSFIKNFTSTEHGYIQTYLIIRGQPSLANGIDKQLGYDSLLDTYLPPFDHIGPVGIEQLEISNSIMASDSYLYFGYTNAWYPERNPVSDVVGIVAPGQPLEYKTLAVDYNIGTYPNLSPVVISDSFLRHSPKIIDRIFAFPVCYMEPNYTNITDGVYADEKGQDLASNRYQFICQFVVKGKIAKVMSPDSEPLKLRL